MQTGFNVTYATNQILLYLVCECLECDCSTCCDDWFQCSTQVVVLADLRSKYVTGRVMQPSKHIDDTGAFVWLGPVNASAAIVLKIMSTLQVICMIYFADSQLYGYMCEWAIKPQI